ncbi:MAG TPA: enolase C-terminal domain-like protein, partial [Acidimicrobiia bacterium]|nr:enolase C-terminal domain-like protein [Acidimicrobiia bacterium]
ASAGGVTGTGYAYGSGAATAVAEDVLFPAVRCPAGGEARRSAADVAGAFAAMARSVRNVGRAGVASTALSATDTALWDLKARLLGLPLADLLGRVRPAVAAYGSGGFCSYDDDRLADQLGGWAGEGYRMVKMKVGRHPDADLERVAVARRAIGPGVELFVDANGAYSRKQALAFADAFAPLGVTWFEEPVSSDDLDGLRLLRDRGPAGMAIAAGEYGHDLYYFRRMLAAGAGDVLQADATRCGGVSGFLGVDALCRAFGVPLSAHTSPSLHAHLCCAAPAAVHVEAFFDHLRLESLVFDGALAPENGMLRPAADRPGLGLTLKEERTA